MVGGCWDCTLQLQAVLLPISRRTLPSVMLCVEGLDSSQRSCRDFGVLAANRLLICVDTHSVVKCAALILKIGCLPRCCVIKAVSAPPDAAEQQSGAAAWHQT